MDRIDEWRAFEAVATGRSFAAAARALGRSPQAMTRAVAALEERLGTRLLHRTTRSVSLTHDGETYLERARRTLIEVDHLEAPLAADAPLGGRLSVTAPVLFGRIHVLPIVADFLAAHPRLGVRLTLLDRVVSLAEEGIDVAVRLGALPDSTLRARRVGEVRTIVCASPRYLRRAGVPREPTDLAHHSCISFTGTTPIAERWSFPGRSRRDRSVAVHPRLIVNAADAAIEAAVAGLGLTRVLSYQVAERLAARKLAIVLADNEPAPSPVHLLSLPGTPARAPTAFLEFAAARLRKRLAPRSSRR